MINIHIEDMGRPYCTSIQTCDQCALYKTSDHILFCTSLQMCCRIMMIDRHIDCIENMGRPYCTSIQTCDQYALYKTSGYISFCTSLQMCYDR